MIDTMLVDSLIDFLKDVFSDFTVEDEKGKQWTLAIIKGFLPPKRTDSLEDNEKFCVLVRYDDGESNWIAAESQAKAINRVIIAVRTASFDVKIGPQNTVNVMAMIQQHIYSDPILANKYRATFPLKWAAPSDTESLPIWQGQMIIPYYVPTVQEIFNGGVYNE